MSSSRSFLLTRLHSLAGLIPLGLFLIEHFYSNAIAMLGAENYDKHVKMLLGIPFLIVIEILFIAVPLLYHAGYGLYIAFIARNNAIRYSFTRNWMFALQRASGIVTLIFILYHIWVFRLSSLIYGTPINYDAVHTHLSSVWILLFYIVGVVATTFHFANGIWSGLITWGVTRGAKAQRVSAYVSYGIFVVLSVVGVATLFSFQ